MSVNIDQGYLNYNLFYQLSFILVLCFYFYEGYRRRFNISSWLLLILTVRIFSIIGSKLGSYSLNDFDLLTSQLSLVHEGGKNLMGALLVGLLTIPVSKKLLNIKYPVFDAFAVAVPLSMAVQRLGCLFAGCCYGTETNCIWGIHYSTHGEIISPLLHPVPLYYLLANLLIVLLVLLTQKKWKRPGNSALFSLLLLFFSRFVIDFFRDPASEGELFRLSLAGLYLVQWVCISAVLMIGSIIYLRERQPAAFKPDMTKAQPWHEALYLFTLLLLLYFVRYWLSPIELSVILLLVVPVLILIGRDLFNRYLHFAVRTSTLALLTLSVLLTSQTIPDTTSFQSVRLALSGGKYAEVSACGGVYSKTKFTGLSGGYLYTKQYPKKRFETGMNLFIASYNSDEFITGNSQINTFNFGLNPFFKMDYKWIGLGLGGSVGKYSSANNNDPETIYLLPQVYFRLFPEKYFYLKYEFGECFPYVSSRGYSVLEMGSDLGYDTGFQIGLGLYFDYDFYTTMLGGKMRIPVDKKLLLTPSCYFNMDNDYTRYQFTLGLSYNISR